MLDIDSLLSELSIIKTELFVLALFLIAIYGKLPHRNY